MNGRTVMRWLSISPLLAASWMGCSSYGTEASQAPAHELDDITNGLTGPGRAGDPTADGGGGAETELWVIARPAARAGASGEERPGCGAMMAQTPGESRLVPMPLQRTEVKARIAGPLAAVDVTQRFHNPFDGKIEAVYVFPLPENAAVHEFVMKIGKRRIRGILRERAEAESIYLAARAQGHTASLLTQERPNVFTQKVANLEPGQAVEVAIRYCHMLGYEDGWHQFVFPMVVGPRFNPPWTALDAAGGGSGAGVGAVGRGAQGSSGQRTEVSYLKPGERSGHDITLQVDVDAGVPIEELRAPSHAVEQERPEAQQARVVLSPLDRVPNRDFVLRWRVAGDTMKSALFTHRGQQGGHFAWLLYPPRTLEETPRAPIELVLVLDCSGSMNGEPITQARAAVHRALARLGPDDTFQLLRFSDEAVGLGDTPLAATPANVDRARHCLDALEGEGGTMMLHGIRAALVLPHDSRRQKVIAFLTDGLIGNEQEILGEVARGVGNARVFSFGVGQAPNRWLLDAMARLGHGAVAYLGNGDDGGQVMDRFFDRACRPALRDLRITATAGACGDLQPGRLPDLFAGRPLVVTGRLTGDAALALRMTGRVGERTVTLDTRERRQDHPALPLLWARHRIEELGESALAGGENRSAEMRSLALEFGLVSPWTAFVAVDSLSETAGSTGTTVPVSVPVPRGQRYQTSVGGSK